MHECEQKTCIYTLLCLRCRIQTLCAFTNALTVIAGVIVQTSLVLAAIRNNNQLTSLEGGPKGVGMDFFCYANQLVSLEGAPKIVSGSFYCSHNKLVSLKGSPEGVDGYFDCSNNELVSLVGAPKKVLGDFDCSDNKLVSLEGAPQKVRYIFKCYNNQLVSLEGGPRKVVGFFDCSGNRLSSLKGAPQEVGGYFTCDPISIAEMPIELVTQIRFVVMVGGHYDSAVKLKEFIKKNVKRLSPNIYLKKMIKSNI